MSGEAGPETVSPETVGDLWSIPEQGLFQRTIIPETSPHPDPTPSARLTRARLVVLAELLQDIPPGPWEASHDVLWRSMITRTDPRYPHSFQEVIVDDGTAAPSDETLEFLARSRTSVPDLLQELRLSWRVLEAFWQYLRDTAFELVRVGARVAGVGDGEHAWYQATCLECHARYEASSEMMDAMEVETSISHLETCQTGLAITLFREAYGSRPRPERDE
jgi:hypothetical protein